MKTTWKYKLERIADTAVEDRWELALIVVCLVIVIGSLTSNLIIITIGGILAVALLLLAIFIGDERYVC